MAHRWDAQHVLVQLYEDAGYASETFAWTVMPILVIYADGRVIKTERYSDSKSAWKGVIKLAYLSPDEICSLLTRIDQSGFFDFDMADYVEPEITDLAYTNIIVRAWRSRSISAYALGYASDHPTALHKLYNLLSRYDPPNASPYQIERVALWITSWGIVNFELNPWPTTLPPLKKLAPNEDDRNVVILTGQDITDTYEFFGEGPDRLFVTEDGSAYQVALRPLLPLEIPTTIKPWYPSSFEESPKTQLTCDTSSK
jgi:hypothetical protein